MKGTIWPANDVYGYEAGRDPSAIKQWPTVELGEGLAASYPTAAHWVPYHVPGEPTIPRFNKGAESELLAEIRFDVVVCDVDAPKDVRADGNVSDWSDEQIERLPAGVGWYKTRGGFHCFPLRFVRC